MTFAIRIELPARLRNRDVQPDRRDGVLQSAPIPRVHVYITAGDERNLQLLSQRLESPQLLLVSSGSEQLHGDTDFGPKLVAQPLRLLLLRRIGWNPPDKT